ncbi:MAG: tRNA-binding protein [bacterium]|nr:tRNA-binding protein [bacterium]
MNTITWSEFEAVELRVGTIIQVEDFPEAKIPAYKLWVDLGQVGIRKSSARLTKLYTKEELLGKQVLCVCNFPPKQVGPFVSEILVTGFVCDDEEVVLVHPERPVPNGLRLK